MGWFKRVFGGSFEVNFERACEDPFDLRNKKLEELCDWIGQWNEGSANRLIGMNELKRRQERETRIIAYIALFISVASLFIAALNAFLSYLGKK
jgi:hypothetical protein